MQTTEAERRDDEGFDESEIFVGKDILELLSSSMYINPLSIFREYVQNAADAIDDAVVAGLLSSTDDGKIEIKLDHVDRRVVIRDNGKGLSNKDFAARMLSFGASEKRGTDARGFRGVGRLSGLGYVQQLNFRSRSRGDAKVLEATWDGHAVKRLLASSDGDSDLRSIVREAVTLKRLEPEEDHPAHFFEVELNRPRRIGNDRLLNEVEIEAFIGQVCPCPFSQDFPFRKNVAALLAPHGRAGKSYWIHINDAEEPVCRPYRNGVQYSETKRGEFHEFKSFEIEGIEGDTAAVGWLIHHDYQGAIPISEGVRGLRARVGNIQVGHDRLFLDIFPEDRFCSWTIGEVHVLDARVVPNGRRDEFESNAHLDNLIAHLRPKADEVAHECRSASQKRNRQKAFDLAEDKIHEMLDVIRQGAISKGYAKSITTEISALFAEMERAVASDFFENEEQRALRIRLADLNQKMNEHTAKAKGDALKILPDKMRAAYREIFDLVYECSNNRIVAKSLIDKMLTRLPRL